jgi:hypothetical protein
MLILDGIFITIYLFLYVINPEFRESEKLRREVEKNNNYKREESILSENNESKEKILNIKIREISKNKNLIKNCFDDPFFCVNDKNLYTKLKENLSNPAFEENYKNEWIKSFSGTYYGCFCRNNINLSIYETCPIDINSLDYACKLRHQCIKDFNEEWINSSKCDEKFENHIKLILKNNSKDKRDHIRERILNRYLSLLKLKNLINQF